MKKGDVVEMKRGSREHEKSLDYREQVARLLARRVQQAIGEPDFSERELAKSQEALRRVLGRGIRLGLLERVVRPLEDGNGLTATIRDRVTD